MPPRPWPKRKTEKDEIEAEVENILSRLIVNELGELFKRRVKRAQKWSLMVAFNQSVTL
jgi:hypothetical protein